MGRLIRNGQYCAYLRKSRADVEEEARGRGETLARHERILRDTAERMGIRISATYREIVSGDTIAERPEVRRLLADIGTGKWNGVLVVDVDRLGRGDSIDQGVIMQTFLYSNTSIITPDKVYDPLDDADAEFFEIKLFFSRREYSMIKKRLQRGRIASAMDGCYQSPRPPFGYERYKLPNRKGYSLRIVEEKAEVVRNVFSWYAYGINGQSVGAALIADRLNQAGIRTDLGNIFKADRIRNMLKNPTYVGMIRWNTLVTERQIDESGVRSRRRVPSSNPILVKGRHEPIIDQELWDKVQNIISTHEKRPKNMMSHIAHPLCGLVVCKECGYRMMGKHDKTGSYLYCTTQHCPTCSAKISAVEDIILAEIEKWTKQLQIQDVKLEEKSLDLEAAKAMRRQLEAQRATLQSQFGRLYDFLEQGIYTTDIFYERRDALNARIAAIDQSLHDLEVDDPSNSAIDLAIRARKALDAYRVAETAEEKNNLLRTVVDHVVYQKSRQCGRNNHPGDFIELKLFPATPKT